MFKYSDVRRLVEAAKRDEQCRTLILIDDTNGQAVTQGRFVHAYDASVTASVEAFFDSTFRIFDECRQGLVFTSGTLPVLYYIGPFKVTLLRKASDNTCFITDAENVPFVDYAGLGG